MVTLTRNYNQHGVLQRNDINIWDLLNRFVRSLQTIHKSSRPWRLLLLMTQDKKTRTYSRRRRANDDVPGAAVNEDGDINTSGNIFSNNNGWTCAAAWGLNTGGDFDYCEKEVFDFA